MSRNSGGTYTLPGVAFVNGTVADAGAVNAKFADLGVEMTDSLSRSGKGGMSGALLLADGSDPFPALAFTADESVGLRYDVGSTEVRLLAAGDTLQAWSLSQVLINQPLSISGALTASGVLKVGNGTSSAPALSFGADTDTGFYRAGAADVRLQIDATQVQKWTASAVTINQPLTISGALNTGQVVAIAASSFGVNSTGAAGFSGGVFANGTAATATVPQAALQVTNGYIGFEGVANPNKDVGFTNTLTPTSIAKAWGTFTSDGAAGLTVNDGFNVTAVFNGNDLEVRFVNDMADTNYAVVMSTTFQVASGSPGYLFAITNKAVGSCRVQAGTTSGGPVSIATNAMTIHVIAFGRQ